MKIRLFIIFVLVSIIISLTGCGSSGSSNSVAPAPTTMTSVKVSLTQNGKAVNGADVALYTPAAAMREGLNQAQNTVSRASVSNNNTQGVYTPTSTSDDGTYTFEVPTGEYTLIANKGNSKAVVTSLRAATAEGDSNTTVNTELQPTGTITGTVATGSAQIVTGAIVYLENTSCVTFAKADGTFSMNGVPVSSKSYSIAAISSQNGKMYKASSKSVPMTSSLSFSGVALSLEEVIDNTYTITGYVKGSDNSAIASVTVMASDETTLFVGTTDSEGKFSIKVNDEIPYFVSVVGATNETKSVYVSKTSVSPSGEDLVFTIINTPPDPSYGTIKGSIRFSSDYIEYCRSTETFPDYGRYLVRLIGSATANTSYNSSIRLEYKGSLEQNDTVVDFVFDSVPAGTYSIFVDPAENGFLGSIGNITIAKGETKNAGAIDVSFVKPVFEAIVDGSNLQINMPYPFIYDSDEMKYYYRKIGSDTSLLKASIISMDKVLFLADENNNDSFLFSSGKYEIVFQNPWSDTNTGLKGSLIETQVVNYTSDPYSEIIGDVIVRKKNLTEGDFPGVRGCPKLNYCDGYISGGYYNDDGEPIFFFLTGDTGQFIDNDLDTLAISKTSILYSDGEYLVGRSLKYVEDYSVDNYQVKTIPYEEDIDSCILESAALLYKKYLCVYYSLSGTAYAKVFEYGNNPDNPFSNQVATYTMSGYGIRGVALAESPSGKCYTAILYEGNPQEIVKIYEAGKTEECASYNLSNPRALGILNFQALVDGSFYVEFEEGDDGGNNSMKSVRMISGNIFEESNLMNRKSCIMDKYGFMYRVDTLTNSVIKTASLDGEPLETYKISTGGIGDTGPIYEPLNGILGLATVDYEDLPVLLVW